MTATSRKTALIGFTMAAATTLAGHGVFLSRKIHRISGEQYARYGVDLRVDPEWRIGFFSGIHGAVLVKAPNVGPPRTETDTPSHRQLRPLMARELRLIPYKFLVEASFYLLLTAYLFLLATPLLTALLGRGRSRFSRLVARFVPGAVFFALAAAPLLIWGYGYGGFSNLAGPGAMSFSGPYFHLRSWLENSSNSISYRALVSVLMLPVDLVVSLGWEGIRHLPIYGSVIDSYPETWAGHWLGGLLLYGFAGLVLQRRVTGFREPPP